MKKLFAILCLVFSGLIATAEQLTCYDQWHSSPTVLQQTHTKAFASLCIRPGELGCGTTITLGYYNTVAASVRMYVVGYRRASDGSVEAVYLNQRFYPNTAATSMTFSFGRCDEYLWVVGHTIVSGPVTASASVTVSVDH